MSYIDKRVIDAINDPERIEARSDKVGDAAWEEFCEKKLIALAKKLKKEAIEKINGMREYMKNPRYKQIHVLFISDEKRKSLLPNQDYTFDAAEPIDDYDILSLIEQYNGIYLTDYKPTIIGPDEQWGGNLYAYRYTYRLSAE